MHAGIYIVVWWLEINMFSVNTGDIWDTILMSPAMITSIASIDQ